MVTAVADTEAANSKVAKTYHYHIEQWRIPSRRSHNSLVKRLTDFLDEYECKENLLVIYYGGHGHLNDDRQLTWSWLVKSLTLLHYEETGVVLLQVRADE